MKALPSVLAAALVFSAALTISSRAIARHSAPSQSPSGDSFPNKSVTIYVADFDIDALRATERHSTLANVPPATTGGTTASPPASLLQRRQTPTELPRFRAAQTRASPTPRNPTVCNPIRSALIRSEQKQKTMVPPPRRPPGSST